MLWQENKRKDEQLKQIALAEERQREQERIELEKQEKLALQKQVNELNGKVLQLNGQVSDLSGKAEELDRLKNNKPQSWFNERLQESRSRLENQPVPAARVIPRTNPQPNP